MPLLATVICLIACHGGPADHFATFAESLAQDGYEVHVYASGPALKKFQERNIQVVMPFAADNLSQAEEVALASQIAERCSQASVVLTDVGHSFDITLQKALAKEAPKVMRLAYYDNAEPYVPGGYSLVAAEVMQAAQRVLFANANLRDAKLYREPNKEILLSFKNRVGIGYYPLAQAEKISARRAEEGAKMRAELLTRYGLKDKKQKLLVYFGGNNEEYFTKALPAFLSFLSEGVKNRSFSNEVFVVQQHPGAKASGRDRVLIEAWISKHLDAQAPRIILSDGASDAMQVVADAALYYQTSMGPLFALAGIPTIQVGHETYEDVLVRGGLCTAVTSSQSLFKALAAVAPAPAPVSQDLRDTIHKSLGIQEEWFTILKSAVK